MYAPYLNLFWVIGSSPVPEMKLETQKQTQNWIKSCYHAQIGFCFSHYVHLYYMVVESGIWVLGNEILGPEPWLEFYSVLYSGLESWHKLKLGLDIGLIPSFQLRCFGRRSICESVLIPNLCYYFLDLLSNLYAIFFVIYTFPSLLCPFLKYYFLVLLKWRNVIDDFVPSNIWKGTSVTKVWDIGCLIQPLHFSRLVLFIVHVGQCWSFPQGNRCHVAIFNCMILLPNLLRFNSPDMFQIFILLKPPNQQIRSNLVDLIYSSSWTFVWNWTH